MFGDQDFDDDHFPGSHSFTEVTIRDMSFQATLYIVGIIVLIVLLIACCCHCCCRRREGGQVLSPAPATTQITVQAPAPYPQQQYNAPYPTQAVTTYPVHAGAQVAYPAAYPYPSPQPAPVAAPYPVAYPHPHPPAAYPPTAPSAPTAPDANAMPPSYEQAVCAKAPPHNPYASQ